MQIALTRNAERLTIVSLLFSRWATSLGESKPSSLHLPPLRANKTSFHYISLFTEKAREGILQNEREENYKHIFLLFKCLEGLSINLLPWIIREGGGGKGGKNQKILQRLMAKGFSSGADHRKRERMTSFTR